jgi:hypothetical protein
MGSTSTAADAAKAMNIVRGVIGRAVESGRL